MRFLTSNEIVERAMARKTRSQEVAYGLLRVIVVVLFTILFLIWVNM